DREKVMAFNTPAELLAIEEVLGQGKKGGRVQALETDNLDGARLKPAGEWLDLLTNPSEELEEMIRGTYGSDAVILSEQKAQIVAVLERFVQRHGPGRKVVVCRAPGRINLMGR